MHRFLWASFLASTIVLSGLRSLRAGVTAAEYFIGTDPGVGAATVLTIENSVGAASLTEAITLVTSTLPMGTHDIGLRVQDSSGNWSNTLLRRITVQDSGFELAGGLSKIDPANQAPQVFNQTTAAEYFIGTDPGVGAATPLLVDTSIGAVATLETALLTTSGLSAGTYNVSLRVQDSEGRWSNSIQRRFTIFASSLVTATEIALAESSLDYDQAEVNQAWLLSLGGAITGDSYTLSINGETITVNTRYAETRYGLLNRILSAINGNPFINASYIAELVGSTQIKVQALSSGNQSSSTIAVSENIDVSVVATGNIGSQGRKLIAAEYFINDDPGPGSATPLATFADSDKYALRTQEAAIDMATMRAGSHRVGIRFQNQAGRWSQPLYHSVNIFSLYGDADTTAPVITLTGGASVSIPYQGTYAEVGFTAIDDIDGDLSSAVVIEGQIDSNRPGDQLLTYKITDTAGNLATATRTVTVVDSQSPTIIGTSEASYLAPPAIIDLYDGLVVSDPEFGDLTYALKIKTSNVDWFTAGNYYVTYEVEDPAGNTNEFTRNYFLSAGAIAYPSYQAWIDGRGDPLGITVADRLPGADPDGDFVINEDEWYADTDPFDKFSLLTMDTVRNDSQLLLHWSGLMRNQYWIESSHDLTLWESYTEKYTIDGGAYFELGVDFASPEQPKSFYRLATEPRLPIDD